MQHKAVQKLIKDNKIWLIIAVLDNIDTHKNFKYNDALNEIHDYFYIFRDLFDFQDLYNINNNEVKQVQDAINKLI